MTVTYPKRLSLAQIPTPLQPLDRLSEYLGGPRIWVKRDDLTGSSLSGNKVRKLEFVIAQALEEGCDTLITCGGLQSNHCRVTALLGAQLGLKVHLILRGKPQGVADGNLLLGHLAGAQVSCYSPQEYQTDLADIFEQWQTYYHKKGQKAFLIPTGASDDIGVWGYVRACEELASDFQTEKIQPHTLYTATGSGGTQAGLSVGAHLFHLGAQVVGMAVCDNEAYFQHKVREDLDGWQARYGVSVDLAQIKIITNDHYVGKGYAIASQAVFDSIAQVARLEGLVLDPVYTGKAFYGMIQELQKGKMPKEGDIVFIHTGGVFGLFPHRQQLLKSLSDTESEP